jgi:Zn-finger nucleic acid-binding protein
MDLTCTGCGGRLPPEGARETVTCRYCGATCVPPPEVIEHVVERVVVQRIPLPTGGEAGPPGMPCPRCAAYLKEKRVHAALIAACRECGGIWVDAATVERLKSAHDEELENAARRINGPLVLVGPPPDQRLAISCPVCSGPLRRVEIPDTMHSVDVCDVHGTWFDRCNGDELQMFVTSFAEARAGEVTEGDLRSAGVGGGFFSRLFR